MDSNTTPSKEQMFHMFVDPVAGVEPYDSFFRSVGERRMSEDLTVRQVARREWLAFMRTHAADFLTRFPKMRDYLVAFLEDFLETRRNLRASTRADAKAVLTVAKNM